jgi:hypothetical protein
MHNRRRWCVSEVDSPEELARKLTSATWTLCTGFYVREHPQYLFLNDSTHEDAAVEFAVYGAVIVMWCCFRPQGFFRHFVPINFT